MLPTILILAFPLVAALGYTIFYTLAYVAAGKRGIDGANRIAPLLYVILLGVPLAGVFWGGLGQRPERFGLALPRIGGVAPGAATVLAVVIGGAVGAALFFNERALVRRFRSGSPGGTEAAQPGVLPLPRWALAVTSILVVPTEEFLWRGYLITYLRDVWEWPVALAWAVAALSFAAHHYRFGTINIMLKAVSGLAWGGLFLWSASLVPGVISHLAFDFLVWKQFTRQGA